MRCQVNRLDRILGLCILAVLVLACNAIPLPPSQATPTREARAQFVATPIATTREAGTPLPTATLTRRISPTNTPVKASPTPSSANCPALQVTVGQVKIDVPAVPVQVEIEIGADAAAEIEKANRLWNNAEVLARLNRIGQAIVPQSDRPSLTYTFKLLDSDEVNALALPGGFIYVTRGMIEFVKSDDELAGVIGHEIAHVARCHGAEQIQSETALTMAARQLRRSDPNIFRSERTRLAAKMQLKVQEAGWSREQELEADQYGTIYMAHAGYNPQAVIDLLKRMDAHSKEPRSKLGRLLATHPPFAERIATVERTIQQNKLE